MLKGRFFECGKCSYRCKRLYNMNRHVQDCQWITDIPNHSITRDECDGDLREATEEIIGDVVAVTQLSQCLMDRAILIDDKPLVRFGMDESTEAQERLWTYNVILTKMILAFGGEDSEADYERLARLCYLKHVVVQRNIRRGECGCIQTFDGDHWIDCPNFEDEVIEMMKVDLQYLWDNGMKFASSYDMREVARSLRSSVGKFLKTFKPSRVPVKEHFVNFYTRSLKFRSNMKKRATYKSNIVSKIESSTDEEITEIVIPILRVKAPWILKIWESSRLSHLMGCDIPISISENGSTSFRHFYMKFSRFEELLNDILQDALNGSVKMLLYKIKLNQTDRFKQPRGKNVWKGTSWGSWKLDELEDWDSQVYELIQDLKRINTGELSSKCRNAQKAIEKYDDEHGVAIGRKLWKELKIS